MVPSKIIVAIIFFIISVSIIVIPAKAGIYDESPVPTMDPRLRGDDT